MAKRSHPTHRDLSDDEEAPEAVSFNSSKKLAKGEQNALRKHHAVLTQKQKEKNRAQDKAAKERAAAIREKEKGKGRPLARSASREGEDGDSEDESEGEDGGGPSKEDLEARMARAMAEAEEESEAEDGEDGDDVSIDGEGSEREYAFQDEEMNDETDEDESAEDEDEEMRIDDEDEDAEDEEKDEDEDEEQEEEHPHLSKLSGKPNYLPEHLFKAALSNAGQSKKIVFNDEPIARPSSPPRKRKRTKRSSRDILLGTRTIRTLPAVTNGVSPAAVKGLAPPRRVSRFVKTTLNLKGDSAKSRKKGWSRTPANLGVMKRNGPAANFVRDS